MILIASNLIRPAGQFLLLASFLLTLAMPTLPALAQAGGIPAFNAVSYTHLRSPRDISGTRMPSSA